MLVEHFIEEQKQERGQGKAVIQNYSKTSANMTELVTNSMQANNIAYGPVKENGRFQKATARGGGSIGELVRQNAELRVKEICGSRHKEQAQTASRSNTGFHELCFTV
jgi:hypothetical protein